MNNVRGLTALLVLGMLGQPAIGASRLKRPKPKPVAAKVVVPLPAPVPVEAPPPPYEPQLLRLSELMGALTWLRDLCDARDGELWRARMAGIIDADATTPSRREKLAGAFNKGFRDYQITYRTCTPNAAIIITRYLDEGSRLAHEIGNRYSGG